MRDTDDPHPRADWPQGNLHGLPTTSTQPAAPPRLPSGTAQWTPRCPAGAPSCSQDTWTELSKAAPMLPLGPGTAQSPVQPWAQPTSMHPLTAGVPRSGSKLPSPHQEQQPHLQEEPDARAERAWGRRCCSPGFSVGGLGTGRSDPSPPLYLPGAGPTPKEQRAPEGSDTGQDPVGSWAQKPSVSPIS